mmetsp:Transcript_8645/g.14215  ORF Transcript_8645/g.14215 Transcript_8645/m.14215 type:complete len:481 (-) Transcript_8645:238-1680(-)|eukprot:CAMPEP_0197049146 /NCGR_PEP_ID=MMETSP1384-20130603/24345_1 /TAXON_ID=29189 /ORGANISM="Ammonia sp." /LENGTH=480 /DNA_ID=CAMNT_0042481381 /DNA_START=33 /DNA_END=1475 /DNA_ORIENTATION=-
MAAESRKGGNKRKSSKSKSKSKKLLKQFSTLSEGSLHSPSLSLCLQLVSKLYHRHITLRDGCHESRRDVEWEEKFDIDNFLAKRYDTFMTYPLMSIGGATIFKQQRKRSKVNTPTLDTINTFLIGIFKKLHLNVESSIVSLIYTERLMDKRHISLTLRNWRPILIASILTASKVWDDLSSWNIEFSNLLPVLSLSNINKLEGLYLQALQYDLYISSSEYARYYFALRGLKNTKTEHIPRYYLDMKIASNASASGPLFPPQTLHHHSPHRNPLTDSPQEAEISINQSLSRRARDFEQKSIMHHARNIKLDARELSVEHSMVEEEKYPDIAQSEHHRASHGHDSEETGDHSLLSAALNGTHLNQSMASNVSAFSRSQRNQSVNSMNEEALTSSSDSNKSNKSSHSNHSYRGMDKEHIIKEEEEVSPRYPHSNNMNFNANLELDYKRSKAMILKPNKVSSTKSNALPSYSMPSNLQTIRPING